MGWLFTGFGLHVTIRDPGRRLVRQTPPELHDAGKSTSLTSVAPPRFHPDALEVLVCTAAAQRFDAVTFEVPESAR